VVLVFPLLAACYFWYMAGNLGARFAALEVRQAALTQGLRTDQIPTRNSLEAPIKQLQGRIDALKGSLGRIEWLSRATSLLLFGGVVYGLFFWLPLTAMRRLFEGEVNRFTLRIQGMADKSELADLALAESVVVDEESLHTFVKIAAAVAERHGVLPLAERFDLWASGPGAQASNPNV
jgi:hypothetical protein